MSGNGAADAPGLDTGGDRVKARDGGQYNSKPGAGGCRAGPDAPARFGSKPLGTGVVAAAIKAGVAGPAMRTAAVETMAALNGPASRAMVEAGIECATDVTGYGLAGHLREIMSASVVSARVEMDAVPVLAGVADLIDSGIFPGGSRRNLESARPRIRTLREDRELRILADAQTSGGLLMAVPPRRLGRLLKLLVQIAPAATVIGEFTATDGEPVIEVV